MWWAVYDGRSWAISRKALSWGSLKCFAQFSEAKEFISRYLHDRRSVAMKPVEAIDRDIERLAAMEEPE